MSKMNKTQITNSFTNNMGSYIGYGDIQEVITGITFLYWHAKYVINKPVPNSSNQQELDSYLQSSNKEDESIILDVCNTIRNCIAESNLSNIFNYLNTFTEEELINIICDDYSSSSRYNSSTPESIISLASKILETADGSSIMDLCSYTGNFLSQYAKLIPKYIYNGIEINRHSGLISKLKLIALGVKHDIKIDNVFNIINSKKYDKIFCNQPFNIRLEVEDYNNINKCNKIINENFTKRITSDWVFACKIVNFLSNKGKGIIIVPNGCLFKQPDAHVREELVTKGLIEAVISLPGNLFNNTNIPTTLIVFSKNNKFIKFIDASKLYVNSFPINQLEVEKIYNEYLNIDNSEITKTLDIDEINNEFNLSVDCYMDVEKIEIKYPKKLIDVSENIFRGYQISSREIDQFSAPSLENKEYKIINIVNINEGKIVGELNSIFPDSDKYEKYILKNNDLVISSKGTVNKLFVASINKNEKYIPSGNFTVIRLKQDLINPIYLKLFFESIKGTKVINSIKSGGILPALNISQLKEINVPVPSIDVQNKIVSKYLAKSDEIEILKNKLQNAEISLQDYANEEF